MIQDRSFLIQPRVLCHDIGYRSGTTEKSQCSQVNTGVVRFPVRCLLLEIKKHIFLLCASLVTFDLSHICRNIRVADKRERESTCTQRWTKKVTSMLYFA